VADVRVGPYLDRDLAADNVFGVVISPGNPTGNLIGYSVTAVAPPPTPTQESSPHNLVSRRLGQYHQSKTRSGNILYRRSDSHTPPFEFENNVTTAGTDDYSCMVIEPATERTYCLWIRNRGTFPPGANQERAMEAFSDDDGETWSTPAVIFQGANTVAAAVGNHDGAIFRAAYVGVNGSAFWMQGTYQAPGDATPTAADVFDLLDVTGARITLQTPIFSVASDPSIDSLWILTCAATGLGAGRWHSTDDCRTWQRQTDSVFPVPSAMSSAIGRHDRALFRCALDTVSGATFLRGTYQAPGDGPVSTPDIFTLLDTTGARFTLQGVAFGVDSSPDIAGAWLLTCVRTGEKNASDWISTDDCRTWERL